GGRLGEHVAAGEHVGDDELLDGERRGDPAFRQGTAHGGGHAEIGEGLTGQMKTPVRHPAGPRTIREATANPNRTLAGPKQAASQQAAPTAFPTIAGEIVAYARAPSGATRTTSQASPSRSMVRMTMLERSTCHHFSP